MGNSLAAYSTSCTVLNGGVVETDLYGTAPRPYPTRDALDIGMTAFEELD